MRRLYLNLHLRLWDWRARRAERRLFRLIGRGDETAGARLFRDAVRGSVEGT